VVVGSVDDVGDVDVVGLVSVGGVDDVDDVDVVGLWRAVARCRCEVCMLLSVAAMFCITQVNSRRT
jgi:hypothetical protein